MHANRFERDVQEKLQGMQVQPTPPVWAAVEGRIRRERRRRRLLFFWLLPLLLLGFGIVRWGNNSPAPDTPGAMAERSTPAERSRISTDVQPSRNRGDMHEDIVPIKSVAQPATGSTVSDPNPVDAAPVMGQGPTATAKNRRRNTVSVAKRAKGNNDFRKTKGSATTSDASSPARSYSAPLAATAATTPLPAMIPAETPLPDSAGKITAALPRADTAAKATTPAVSPKPSKRRMQWAFEAGAGIAQPSGGATEARADAFSALASNSGSSTQSWQSGPALHASLRLSLPLKGRLRLQTGVGLEWMRLRHETTSTYYSGMGSSGTPFTGTSSNSFTKSTDLQPLLFVQLPVALEWRPSARSSFTVNGGLRIDQMLSKRVGYGLQSTTVNVELGARFRVMKVGRHSIEAGPRFSAGLTRFDATRRLLGAGATLRFSF
ncbi:MAG: hypothetical protein EOO08_04060 [Chitinophagaceae bacterium]|nr:MAG: hypothetical protein EOO08_04060 [Chitinophagaceae bacterium]